MYASTWEEYKTLEVEVNYHLYQVEVLLTKCRDYSYGADADGRRYTVRDFIEDWRIDTVFDLESGREVSEQKAADPDLLGAVQAAI